MYSCEHQVSNLVFFNSYEVHSISTRFSHLTSLVHTSGGIRSEDTTSPSLFKAAQVGHKGVNPFTQPLHTHKPHRVDRRRGAQTHIPSGRHGKGTSYSIYEQDEVMLKPWVDPHRLKKINGTWYKDGRQVVTNDLKHRRSLIQSHHDPPVYGHPGINRTI